MKIDYILDTKVDFHNETLQIEFRKATEVLSRWVFDTRDIAFRDALIKLGWTPPPDEKSKG